MFTQNSIKSLNKYCILCELNKFAQIFTENEELLEQITFKHLTTSHGQYKAPLYNMIQAEDRTLYDMLLMKRPDLKSEMIEYETKNIVEKNIKEYRFDEAARSAYQFVWHSYCDWYLELSKTILYSNNMTAIKEVREIASFVFKEILVLMHPFIPFVTEEIWLKNKLFLKRELFNELKSWLIY